jgi:hypothetical protein
MSGQIWLLPFFIYLNVVNITKVNKWIVWTVITLLLTYPNAHPIQVGWNSRNSNTVRSRTVSAACYNMFVQASGIISSNIYRASTFPIEPCGDKLFTNNIIDDAPRYKRGNRILLAINIINIPLYLAVKGYYIWRNRVRENKWNSMTEAERLEYLATTKDEGNKRLDFRFQH